MGLSLIDLRTGQDLGAVISTTAGGAEVLVRSDPASAAAVRDALAAAGLHVAATELVWRPATDVDVGDADAVAGALLALEDHPDVAAVFSNAKFPDA